MSTGARILANQYVFAADPSATFAACWLCDPRPSSSDAALCVACRADLVEAMEHEREIRALLDAELEQDQTWSDGARAADEASRARRSDRFLRSTQAAAGVAEREAAVAGPRGGR